MNFQQAWEHMKAGFVCSTTFHPGLFRINDDDELEVSEEPYTWTKSTAELSWIMNTEWHVVSSEIYTYCEAVKFITKNPKLVFNLIDDPETTLRQHHSGPDFTVTIQIGDSIFPSATTESRYITAEWHLCPDKMETC